VSRRILPAVLLCAFALAGCAAPPPPPASTATAEPQPNFSNIPHAAATLVLHAEFPLGKPLSSKYAMIGCGGQNISPRLSWSGAAPATRSYVLTLTDSDESDAFHWIAADIPRTTTMLPSGAGTHHLAAYGRYPKSSFGTVGYTGPCPPAGKLHHYAFTLYALDVPHLPIDGPVQVQPYMAGHIIAEATLLARYQR
jgi:Raf kinase inhibitor-like YbhB/YbcL family protein